MPVLEGNTISVHGSDIDKGKADPTTVKWKQNFKEVSKDFIVAQFTIVATKDTNGETGPETTSLIFIQKDMLQAFEDKNTGKAPDFNVVVDKTFQYGQKSKDGTGRWLAFHDNQDKPYQHRFLKSYIEKGADIAAKIAKELGYDSGDALINDVSSFVGDQLHNF